MKPQNYPTDPKELWEEFYNFCQIPHPSKKEDKIREYIIGVAKIHRLKFATDDVGNVVIYLPGTVGYEDHEPVILQGHMDMVTDNIPEREINFDTDPIEVMVEDGWVTANGTTLGADNGIGCATALAMIMTKGLKHPPLELLFTVDEETGLNGALNLDPSMLSAKKMINLDTEEWGSFYIGCAGGFDMDLFGKFDQTNPSNGAIPMRVELKGLSGGHSGCDIHLQHSNAIKMLCEMLSECKKYGIELSEFVGGKAHNIIPRDAYLHLFVPGKSRDQFIKGMQRIKDSYITILEKADQELELNITEDGLYSGKVLTKASFERFLSIIIFFPHGVFKMELHSKDPLVSTSSNLATVNLENGKLHLLTSLRFFDPLESAELENKVHAIAKTFSLELQKHSGYPSWKPVYNNPLLELAKVKYKEKYGQDAKILAIHAGLECGILREKLGDLDILSMGANLKGAHSPSERVEISSVKEYWEFLVEFLETL